MVILSENNIIGIEDLSLSTLSSKLQIRESLTEDKDMLIKYLSLPQISENGIELNKLLKEIEVYYLKKALEISKGVKTKAAKLLGLNRTTFIEKLKKYNLV